MEKNLKIDGAASSALNRLQDTKLTPMEEVLFKAWTKANGIKEPDAPEDVVDYRGIYRETNGEVLPHGVLKQYAEETNNEQKLMQILQERMQERIQQTVGSAQDRADDQFKAERQDITHKQKMEMEGLKLKRAPIDLKMKEHDIKGKEFDVEKQKVGIETAKIGNEGKQIDLMASLMQPQRPLGAGNASTKPTGKNNATR